MADIWTIQRVLLWTSERFAKKQLDSPRLTAELLLAHVLGCDRVKLYLDFERPLSKEELAAFRGLIERRSAGVPTHYLIGKREFYGRPFVVDARVLIPRPETEQLVEIVLELTKTARGGVVVDVGTGSGAIALSLLREGRFAQVIGTDVSLDALDVARINAERYALGVCAQFELRHGSLLGPVPERGLRAVVSNPPYIAFEEAAALPSAVRDWEPAVALYAGQDGMAPTAQLIREAAPALAPAGILALEVDVRRAATVAELATSHGSYDDVRILLDLTGRERFVVARRREE